METFALAVPPNPTDHVIGPTSAHVVVVEYGDFECPNCQQAHAVVKIMLKHFEHRLRFIFRHYPLTEVHPHAEFAAEAAEAAGAQGRFWPMYDRLFEHPSQLKLRDLRHHAEFLELDLARYDNELSDQVYRQRVNEHREGGRRSGVRSTPTFFLDGHVVDVSFGLENLMKALEKATKR